MAIGFEAEAELARRFGKLAVQAGMESKQMTTIQQALLSGITTGESRFSVAYIDHRSGSSVVVTSYFPMSECCNFMYSVRTPGKDHGSAVFMPHSEAEWEFMTRILSVYFEIDIL